MTLKLRDVKGRGNHFSIFSKRAEEELKNIINDAKEGKSERAEVLQRRLGGVIGIDNAARLSTPQDVIEASQEELERLRGHKQFLISFRKACESAAGRQAEKEFPSFNPRKELGLGAVYHALTRYGVFPALFAYGHYKPDEYLASSIMGGRRLMDYMPARMTDDMLDMLVLSMVDSSARQSFLSRLRALGLSEDFMQQLGDTAADRDVWPKAELDGLLRDVTDPNARSSVYRFFLERRAFEREWSAFCDENGIKPDMKAYITELLTPRHRRMGESQPFRIASALRELQRGNKEVLWALDIKYLISRNLLPLAKLSMEHADLRSMGVHPVHTRVVSVVGTLLNYFSGHHGFPQTLLNYLADLTGTDPYDHLYGWGVRGKGTLIVHPQPEIGDVTLGRIYGSMNARGSYVTTANRWSYKLHNQGAGIMREMTDFGSLSRLPPVISTDAPLPEEFSSDGKPLRSESIMVPRQVGNIFETVAGTIGLPEDEEYRGSREFAVSALRAYAVAKGRPYGGRHSIYFSQGEGSPEPAMRKLAKFVGLDISDGRIEGNQKYCFISNPEAIGLIAA